MKDLLTQHCEAQHGKSPLSQSAAEQWLLTLNGWSMNDNALIATFHFANYYETMAFVNALAWIAHREDHHPELTVHYNRVVVRFSTHDTRGLTLNDFICAAKTNALLTLSA